MGRRFRGVTLWPLPAQYGADRPGSSPHSTAGPVRSPCPSNLKTRPSMRVVFSWGGLWEFVAARRRIRLALSWVVAPHYCGARARLSRPRRGAPPRLRPVRSHSPTNMKRRLPVGVSPFHGVAYGNRTHINGTTTRCANRCTKATMLRIGPLWSGPNSIYPVVSFD